MNKLIKQIIFLVSILVLWQIITLLNVWPEYLFPSPAGVFHSLIEGITNNTLIIGMAISMKRIVIGYGFSLIIGVLFGLLLGSNKLADEILGPVLLGIRTLPSICWLPIGLLWFGLNDKTILFVIIMGATFSISLATRDGVKNIPPIYLKAAATMGTYGFRRYLTVVLPAALPSIITGMKLGWAFAWRSLMAGEMLFVSLGLGHLLMMGRELNDIRQVMAVMIVIVLIGVMIDTLVIGKLENIIRKKWGFEKG